MNDSGPGAILETLALGRLAFALASALFVAGLARLGKPHALLAFTLLANGFIWFETNAPLARPYALGASRDRSGNVQLAAVIAAGRPFYESAQTGQYTIEPGWGLVAAAASGFNPVRLVRLYPWFSLLAPLLVALGIYVGLGGASGLEPWERAFAAYFGTLLVARPIDFTEYFSDPWAMMFLLKPNHALGLALSPLFLRLLSEARTFGTRALSGLLLGLIGWLCVFHMVFLWAALSCFVVVGGGSGGLGIRDRLRIAAPPAFVSAFLTAPYVFVLLFRFPAGQPGPRFGNPASEALLLWPTFQAGVVFALAVAGLLFWRERGTRLSSIWTSLLAGGFAFWLALLILGATFRARERDELLYWIRFNLAIVAGAGIFELARRLEAPLLGRSLIPKARAAALVLITLPFTSAMWWDPNRMDRYFAGSLAPIPDFMRAPGEYLLAHSSPADVVAGDPAFAKFISVFGARRVYLSENLNNGARVLAERYGRQNAFLRTTDKNSACAFAREEAVRFLLVTPLFLDGGGVTLSELRARPFLHERLFMNDDANGFVALFEIACVQAERP